MRTDQSAPVYRYPLYARVCSLLACIVALIALLYVSAFMQARGTEGFRQTLFSLDEAGRLRISAEKLQTASPERAHALRDLADLLVRNDTLLSDWRQRGAPTAELAAALLAATRPAPDIASEPDAKVPALNALRSQVANQLQVHMAVLGLLQACTVALLILGVVSLARGARRAFVTRPDAALQALAETGQALPHGHDEIDRLLKLQTQLAVRLRTEQNESAQLKRIVEDYIAFADQSLELLHHICAQLAEEEPSRRTLEALLQRLVGVVRARRIALVVTESTAQLLDIDLVVSPDGNVPSIVRARVTNELMTLVGTYTFSPLNGEMPPPVLAAPVRVPLASYGVLIAEGEPDTRFEQRHLYLMETIASVLAHAISNVSRDVRDRRMALFEERNAIARELHDSLAQSLSYMKIQLARLQAVLPPELSQSDVAEIARAIREGIDSAYRQLRELLTTFRSPMHAHGLASTLEELAEEFGSRSEVQISIDNRAPRMRLTVNEEMHVAQIVREALTNVIRHARATTAQVQLMSDGDTMTVSIEDDGRGIDRPQGDEHHYGLTIMRERARSLGGRLEVRPAERGSRVVLSFVPAALAAHKARAISGTSVR
ncbi:Signal transduction histidine kinase, nitrate/nitrite-specific [Paraburkholderia piptadeniae]|uniref:Sensor protein n=1 Tax=Paraburkholderia piptadeniae TaxID=1701573 RepID=A0A1N7SNZ1_9BURK|nr:histidine kinase [Paraburkholderia piptadeniae]SIT49065.1 Signal transduction histidine kinase, nitrate/nitrite-specific [Paraburkholderia piptadeniae]